MPKFNEIGQIVGGMLLTVCLVQITPAGWPIWREVLVTVGVVISAMLMVYGKSK